MVSRSYRQSKIVSSILVCAYRVLMFHANVIGNNTTMKKQVIFKDSRDQKSDLIGKIKPCFKISNLFLLGSKLIASVVLYDIFFICFYQKESLSRKFYYRVT